MTKGILEHLGYEIGECPNGLTQTYEIGHEKEEGVFQSSNLAFHRYKMFGSILAKKIADYMRENNLRKCEIGVPKLVRGGKFRYYSVEVKFLKIAELVAHHSV